MAKDMRGINIADNDLIVYPGRDGSRQWANIARVAYTHQDGMSIKVVPFMSNGQRINERGQAYTITYPQHKVYVINLPKLDENDTDVHFTAHNTVTGDVGYAGDPPAYNAASEQVVS